MSNKLNDTLHTFLGIGFVAFFIFILMPLFFAAHFANVATLWLLPEAELTRTKQGVFIVDISNYDNWHTYSKIGKSNSKNAILNGDFVLRAFPQVVDTCDNIKNCQNYQSTFKKVSFEDAQVIVLAKHDDAFFSQFIKNTRSAVKSHNSALIDNYDLTTSFKPTSLSDVNDALSFYEEVDLFNNAPQDSKSEHRVHDQVIQFARLNCRNNGKGCEVNIKLSYIDVIYGGPSLILSR